VRKGERTTSKFLLKPLRCHDCKARYWVPNNKAYLTASAISVCFLLVTYLVWTNFIISNSNIARSKQFDAEKVTIYTVPKNHDGPAHDSALENFIDIIEPNKIDNPQLTEANADKRTFRTQLYYERAQNGDADAQYQLGLAYFNGHDTIQDYEEAAKWLELAAQSNHASAQYRLGLIYKTGLGTDADLEKSYMWLNLSAAAGISLAASERNDVMRSLSPKQLIQAQRASREWIQGQERSTLTNN